MIEEASLEAAAFPAQRRADDAHRTLREGNAAPLRPGRDLVSRRRSEARLFRHLKGEVALKDPGPVGDGILRATLQAGHFTGEVTDISGSPALVSAEAVAPTDAYEITADTLRKIVAQCPDLRDIILTAFLARRQLLRTLPPLPGAARGRLALLARHLPHP